MHRSESGPAFGDLLSTRRQLIDGETSSDELVARSIQRIRETQQSLNAFVYVADERAIVSAQDSDRRISQNRARPLEGIPIAIKDDTAVAGMPTSNGTAMVPRTVETEDALLVSRLREAGAIVIGKTNLPEFGSVPVTENGVGGTTVNPVDASRTPGGSSGGSAVAVAAGLVSAAHGCDGGGSLRIPASCCDLFSLKPTRGWLSKNVSSPAPLTTHGFITRTVADNALLLDVIQGSSFLSDVLKADNAPRLKIAWTASSPVDVPIDARCVDALRRAAGLCEQLGHSVDEAAPDWCDESFQSDFTLIWGKLVGAFVEQLLFIGGDMDAMNAHNRALFELGCSCSSNAYEKAWSNVHDIVQRASVIWSTYDVVLTPTLAQLPVKIGALFDEPSDPLSVIDKAFQFTSYTAIVNLMGQPAAAIPLFQYDGLPVGVQAIGRHGEESSLLQLGAQLEMCRF